MTEAQEKITEIAREMAGYIRAHLAGNNADPELKWALEQYDEAVSENNASD